MQEERSFLTTIKSYPLLEHAADTLHAASGRNIQEITLEAAVAGDLSPADLQVDADTLRAQAAVARNAGFLQLAENLERAAELTVVPNEELLRMYTVLRPGRSTYEELQQLAETLASTYNAPLNAAWVREAATVYRQRNLLRRPL
jgi:propanediol dehydratase small subunit